MNENKSRKENLSPEKQVLKQELIRDYRNGLSIPLLAKKNGFSTWKTFTLLERWGETRNISTAKLKNKDGWRQLVGVGKGKSSKIVSIPFTNLEPLGYKQGEELEGKWIIERDCLTLILRRPEREKKESK